MRIFNNSSSAIRSAPHVGLFSAISPIRFRTSTGTRGRPAGLDFYFQNNRIPFRCQQISVSGFTTVSASRHSKNRESWVRVKRTALVARWGFVSGSTYSASCLRKNRFSAATAGGVRRVSRKNVNMSKKTPTAFLKNFQMASRQDMRNRIARSAKSFTKQQIWTRMTFLRTTGVRASLHETFGRSEAKGIVKTIRLPYPKEAFSIPLTGIVVEQM